MMAMSSKEKGLADQLKELLFQIDEEKLEREVESSEPEDDFLRGGSGGRKSYSEDEDESLSGDRSEYWYEQIESKAEENAKRSRENKLILNRLDLRTTWIMRILIGIIITVGATYIVDVAMI